MRTTRDARKLVAERATTNRASICETISLVLVRHSIFRHRLARTLGVSQSTLYRWSAGESQPDAESLAALQLLEEGALTIEDCTLFEI